jgi:hypothetical protein
MNFFSKKRQNTKILAHVTTTIFSNKQKKKKKLKQTAPVASGRPRVQDPQSSAEPAPPRAERACLALSQSCTPCPRGLWRVSVGGRPASSVSSSPAQPLPPVACIRPPHSASAVFFLASAVSLAGPNQWRSTRGRWWRASSPSPCSSCSAT